MITLNNKYTLALAFIILFILTSCEKVVYVKDELIIYTENKLDKSFIIVYETNIGEKQAYIDSYNKDTLIFKSEQMLEVAALEVYELELNHRIQISDIKIYNISDTTYSMWSQSYYSEIEKEIFRNHLETKKRKINSEFNYTDYEVFTIDSTLLPIFKKDYGMLEQFSEYYK